MLDPTYVRDHAEEVRAGLQHRGLKPDAELEQLATLEARRRRLIPELEGLKREQNAAGDQVARAKRQGQDASSIFAANKARGAAHPADRNRARSRSNTSAPRCS